VDIPYVGKYVLARHWNAATPAEQQAYLAAYKPFVIKNYASKLTKYSGQNYKLKNARAMNSDYAVTMEIVDPGNPSVFVDYTLREEGSSYKVIDIAVEGISLRATQRSEFNAIVNSKGMGYLIEALKKQAAKK
jgi:phospholipid transport system substrate-binding protein